MPVILLFDEGDVALGDPGRGVIGVEDLACVGEVREWGGG